MMVIYKGILKLHIRNLTLLLKLFIWKMQLCDWKNIYIYIYIYIYKHFDKLCFYGDPWAQKDNGAKCSVTNIVKIQRDVKWYNKKFKAPIHMKGAILGKIIIPAAQGWLWVYTNTKRISGYIMFLFSPFHIHFVVWQIYSKV